jgi:hypothetical protein
LGESSHFSYPVSFGDRDSLAEIMPQSNNMHKKLNRLRVATITQLLVISGLYLCFGWFVCLFLFGDI